MNHPSNRPTLESISSLVRWHRPNKEQVERMETIAEACEHMMKAIFESCPECADRTTAIRCLRDARMWANSSIALETNVTERLVYKDITINGRELRSFDESMSHAEIVRLAFPNAIDTQTYTAIASLRGLSMSVKPGQSLHLSDGLEIEVSELAGGA
jgi:hypothetical protein